MPPNKHSFATVLANLGQNDQFHRGGNNDWYRSRDRDSYVTAKTEQSPVGDDFYLNPEPPAPAPAPKRVTGPATKGSKAATPHMLKSKPSALAERRQAAPKPQNISVPVPVSATRSYDDWPLPSPKPSAAEADYAPSPRQVYHNRWRSNSSATVAGRPEGDSKSKTITLAEFLKDGPPSSVNDFAVPQRPSTSGRDKASKESTTFPSHLSFGVKKTVDLPLADFLKEVPPPPKSPLAPLSPRSPFRPNTASTSNSSSKFSFFRGLGFSKPKQNSRQDSRKESSKDSSSISSYHARTQSSPVSENTSRTSFDSFQAPFDECGPHMTLSHVIDEESLAGQDEDYERLEGNSEPLLVPAKMGSKGYHAFSDFDSHTKSEVQTVSDCQTESDLQTMSDTHTGTDAYTTDTGAYADTDMGTEPGLRDESDCLIDSKSFTDTNARTETDLGTYTGNNSVSSLPASIITEADLSAAPPNIRTNRAPATSDPNTVALSNTVKHRTSYDSVAPPPIALIRTGKEPVQPKRSRRDTLNGRLGMIKRATSKPDARPSRYIIDPEQEKRERVAELELLTKSVPYEKAMKGMAPFTNKSVAETYPIRRPAANVPRAPERAKSKSKKRQIGMGLRGEQFLLGAMEDAQWRERECRARIAADYEYMKVMREGRDGTTGPSREQMGLATIEES